jgi:hypothetical protein
MYVQYCTFDYVRVLRYIGKERVACMLARRVIQIWLTRVSGTHSRKGTQNQTGVRCTCEAVAA